MRYKMLACRLIVTGVLISGPGLAWSAQAGAAPQSRPSVGPVSKVSAACAGQNAEVETAIDPATRILYEEWIGCHGIGLARSTDGGKTFSRGFELPNSGAGWDPAITIGPSGTVYAAFMVDHNFRSFPVVDISTDHGTSFPVVRSLTPPPGPVNFGDRDFIAVSPRGAIYVTWDYGPKLDIKIVCSKGGSCSFTAGDINEVVQRSTDGGKTWSKIIPISPGFPASGADIGPVLIEPSGRLDVVYQAYKVLNRKTLKLGVAHDYFTASTDRGAKWSKPRRLGPASSFMKTGEWWIDGDIGIDSAGNLYATWDTQSGGRDIGWLAFSTSHGRTWSRPVRVTRDNDQAVHIVQVTGGAPGIAYVGWLTDSKQCGRVRCYAQYLRAFSIRRGWLTRTIAVSRNFGNSAIWPGDTIGLSLYPGGSRGHHDLAVSWGSALGGAKARSQIWAAVVSHLP